MLCFERQGVPAERQTSDIPAPGEAVKWYQGSPGSPPAFTGVDPAPAAALSFLPLSKCKDSCNGAGWCSTLPLDENTRAAPHARPTRHLLGEPAVGQRAAQDAAAELRDHLLQHHRLTRQRILQDSSQAAGAGAGAGSAAAPVAAGEPRCHCHSGFFGEACERSTTAVCPLGCSGRGECLGGFCKCQAPFFGPGCSRTAAYKLQGEGVPPLPSYTALKIYVYSMPMHLGGPTETDDGEVNVLPTHQAERFFLEALLVDNATLTEDPWSANLFYIPTFTMHASGPHSDATPHLLHAVNHVRSAHPFFNRTGGTDHIVMLSSDRGACRVAPIKPLEPMIKLVHYGLMVGISSPPDTQPHALPRDAPSYGCYKEDRDVVIAPSFEPHMQTLVRAYGGAGGSAGAAALPSPRDLLLFYSSDNKPHDAGHAEHAHTVRQDLAQVLSAEKSDDILFQTGVRPSLRELSALMLRSRFCLVPPAGAAGWSLRLTQAVMHACVPVIIQDHVRQPYEDVLLYHTFSVRVSSREVPGLVALLRAIPDEDVARMQKELAKVHRAFVWQTEFGGMAYSHTLRSLRRRLIYLRGNLILETRESDG